MCLEMLCSMLHCPNINNVYLAICFNSAILSFTSLCWETGSFSLINASSLCQTWRWRTSEDECKWFYRHMIYSPETDVDTTMRYMNIAFQNIDNVYSWGGKYLQHITYSVHNWSSLSRLTLLPSLPVAPWGCCPYPCWWSTAYLALLLGGRALPHSPYPGWPHFAQAPGTFPLLCWIHSL